MSWTKDTSDNNASSLAAIKEGSHKKNNLSFKVLILAKLHERKTTKSTHE